jgi:hypothetical protein
LEDAQQGLFVLHGVWVFHAEGRGDGKGGSCGVDFNISLISRPWFAVNTIAPDIELSRSCLPFGQQKPVTHAKIRPDQRFVDLINKMLKLSPFCCNDPGEH